MFIRSLIRRFIEEDPQVWDLLHRQVPPDRLRAEYDAIRGYLLTECMSADRVALALSRDYRYLLFLLACMETGVMFVPLRVEWPKARIEQIRGIVGYRVLVTDELAAQVVATKPGAGPKERDAAIEPSRPLYCLFTSGTTGMPKGVVIRRESYENFLRWCDGFFGAIGRGDRLLNSTDYTFDVSLAEVALALTRQCAFFCSRFRDDLFTLLAELSELRISAIATVPNNFMMLLDPHWLERADLSGLRHALIAGSRFPVALVRQFREFLPRARVYNCYGPTEATIYCIARELDGNDRGFVEDGTVSVGTPLSGCLARVVDDRMQQVQPSTKGELLIGGVQVMDGYLNNAEATRAALVEIEGVRYYRTGDVAFVNARGDFFVTGRNDDTVKVSGQRVNLSDIDGYVQKMAFVRDCATIAIEDERRGAILVLYVVRSREISTQAALDALREVLPRHQMPQEIRFVESLPLNNSGKISKRALKELYREGAHGD